MLRIRAILVRTWIWIRILGSVPLKRIRMRIRIRLRIRLRILFFSSVTFNISTKNNFSFSKILCLSFLKVNLHHSPKIKSHKIHKTVEIKVFLHFVYLLTEGSGSIQIIYESGFRRSKNIRIRNTENKKEIVLKYTFFIRWEMHVPHIYYDPAPLLQYPVYIVEG